MNFIEKFLVKKMVKKISKKLPEFKTKGEAIIKEYGDLIIEKVFNKIEEIVLEHIEKYQDIKK